MSGNRLFPFLCEQPIIRKLLLSLKWCGATKVCSSSSVVFSMMGKTPILFLCFCLLPNIHNTRQANFYLHRITLRVKYYTGGLNRLPFFIQIWAMQCNVPKQLSTINSQFIRLNYTPILIVCINPNKIALYISHDLELLNYVHFMFYYCYQIFHWRIPEIT